jgi:methionine biosynthesis protein MetW
MLLTGRSPVSENLPFRWYDTPNARFLSIRDFRTHCRENRIRVLRCISLVEGRRSPITFLANLRAEEVIFVITDEV